MLKRSIATAVATSFICMLMISALPSQAALNRAETVAGNCSHITPPEEKDNGCPSGTELSVRALNKTGYFIPPPGLTDRPPTSGTYNLPLAHNVGSNDGRLAIYLRMAAQRQDPLFSLGWAAVELAKNNRELGFAFADLSVTGHRSYAKFRQSPPNETAIVGFLKQNVAIPPNMLDPRNIILKILVTEAARFTPQQLGAAASQALDRAYQSAKWTRTGTTDARIPYGYIAVSGEDDEPYWPVNVASAPYPQYELYVPVLGPRGNVVNVRTRYMIAHKDSPRPPLPGPGRYLPAENMPVLPPNAEVILYIHGMDSRLEEALDMTRALIEYSQRPGKKNYVMIAMDLPTSGYSDKIDPNAVSPITDVGESRVILGVGTDFDAHGRHVVPVLDFIENFIVGFVNTLDQRIPVKTRLRAVIGGSLGGNMTFRLGRRPDLPWLRNIVSWSPASIWNSLADGSDLLKHNAVRVGWDRAGGRQDQLSESESMRREFFTVAYDGGDQSILFVNIVPAQPEMWYRRDWRCRSFAIVQDRLDRMETYTRNFRLWHWRLGIEQLIYSNNTDVDGSHPYLRNTKRMMVGCGKEDDFNYAKICSATMDVASKMNTTPGKAQFLGHTGHSIHNERPNYWTEQVVSFLETEPLPLRKMTIKTEIHNTPNGKLSTTITAVDAANSTINLAGTVGISGLNNRGMLFSASGRTNQPFEHDLCYQQKDNFAVPNQHGATPISQKGFEPTPCGVNVIVPSYEPASFLEPAPSPNKSWDKDAPPVQRVPRERF